MRRIQNGIYKIVVLLCIYLYTNNIIYSQVAININGTEAHSSAMLDISSTDKGFLLPRMTTAERNAITSPANSLMIFNNDDNCLQIYASSQWNNIWCFDCAPSVTSHPSDQTICESDNTSFSVSATGQSLSYQWQVNTGSWNDISAAGSNPTYADWTTATLGVNSVVAANNGYQYRCIVSGSCSPDATSNAGTLTVNSAPAITSHPSDETIGTGGNANFSVTATGAGLTYQWQEDNGGGFSNITDGGSNPAYSGATTAALTLTNVPVGHDTYDYRCIVSGTCSPAATSNSANLTVSTFTCGTSTVDDIDGNTYNTILFGSQCWMTENMRTTKYPDNTPITIGPSAHNDAGWSPDQGYYSCPPNSTNDGEDCAAATSLGLLYQWSAAMDGSTSEGAQGICPDGWHVPTDAEWKTLEGQLGMSVAQQDAIKWRGTDEGSKMAGDAEGVQDWDSSCDAHDDDTDCGDLDSDSDFESSGFDITPSGSRFTGGGYSTRGTAARFFTSTEDDPNVWTRIWNSWTTQVYREPYSKANGWSVRCLKD